MLKMLLITAIFTLLTSYALCQQQVLGRPGEAGLSKQAITPELSELIRKLMNEANVPGMTLGVIHSSNVVELETFGRKTEDDDKMTVDASSAPVRNGGQNIGCAACYRLSSTSCSKAFLAASVGILIDDFARGRNQSALPLGVQTLD